MKRFIPYIVLLSTLVTTPALAQSATAAPQPAQPCVSSGNAELDQLRCELVVAQQALGQANASLVSVTAQNLILSHDLAAARDELKKLEDAKGVKAPAP
jgi:hypothetical protein